MDYTPRYQTARHFPLSNKQLADIRLWVCGQYGDRALPVSDAWPMIAHYAGLPASTFNKPYGEQEEDARLVCAAAVCEFYLLFPQHRTLGARNTLNMLIESWVVFGSLAHAWFIDTEPHIRREYLPARAALRIEDPARLTIDLSDC